MLKLLQVQMLQGQGMSRTFACDRNTRTMSGPMTSFRIGRLTAGDMAPEDFVETVVARA